MMIDIFHFYSNQKYFQKWNNEKLSFKNGDEKNSAGWFIDHYEVMIGHDETGIIFNKACDQLMRYRFYPETILSFESDFKKENRWVKTGDRILQRIHVIRPVVDVLTMNEISEVVNEANMKGFEYVTTVKHGEIGKWSVKLEWKEDKNIIIKIHSVSKPGRALPGFLHSWVRRFQLKAHKKGIEAWGLLGHYSANDCNSWGD